MNRLFFSACFSILTTSLLARGGFQGKSLVGETEIAPWFTGPLLTGSGHVVPEGHQNYEPYLYWTQASGSYDAHWHSVSGPTVNNVLSQTALQFGVLPHTEVDFLPQFEYNETKGEHMWRVSDLPIVLSFQLYTDRRDSWYPAAKFRLGANVPIGKYDHLNPEKLGTDAGGVGGWFPNIGFVFSRLIHISGRHYINWRASVNYAFATPIAVRGLSVYGGSKSLPGVKGTKGTVYPGNVFSFLTAVEYSLTQNWALALDFQYAHSNRRRFSGHSPAMTKPVSPSKELFALAPAIEYNWSSNLGIIAGPWFTFAGRNAGRFISYVVAVNIYN